MHRAYEKMSTTLFSFGVNLLKAETLASILYMYDLVWLEKRTFAVGFDSIFGAGILFSVKIISLVFSKVTLET